MPKRSKAEERLHGILVGTLPRVATQGITESWDKAADSLVKALAVFNLTVQSDPELEAASRPMTAKPRARGVHPHGLTERWNANGKCVVKSCEVYRNAGAAASFAVATRDAAKLPPCPDCGGRATYNGNYFCVEDGDGCGWALCDLEEVGTPAEWGWFRDAYVALMTGRGQVPEANVVAEATLRADAEFWAMGPTEAEVAGALEHLLAAAAAAVETGAR